LFLFYSKFHQNSSKHLERVAKTKQMDENGVHNKTTFLKAVGQKVIPALYVKGDVRFALIWDSKLFK
jgi:hypothetical protein